MVNISLLYHTAICSKMEQVNLVDFDQVKAAAEESSDTDEIIEFL